MVLSIHDQVLKVEPSDNSTGVEKLALYFHLVALHTKTQVGYYTVESRRRLPSTTLTFSRNAWLDLLSAA